MKKKSLRAIERHLNRIDSGYDVHMLRGQKTLRGRVEVCQREPWSTSDERTCYTVPTKKLLRFLDSCRPNVVGGRSLCDAHDVHDFLKDPR